MLADVLLIWFMYVRCYAKVWQMSWPLSYVDRRCVLSSLSDIMPGVADGMATLLRVVYFNLSSGVLKKPHSIYVADGTC